MIKNLLNEIVSHGDRGAVVPISCVDDLKQDMFDLQNGDYHTGYIDGMAGSTDYFIPADLDFEPRSIILVVKPSPKYMLRFNYCGKIFDCIVPPPTVNEHLNAVGILQYINDYLNPHVFMAAGAGSLPQKLLAVHCGLGFYGRNNLFYDSKFGSYVQLLSYVSDMPCDEIESLWLPIKRMETCENCLECVTSCPTKSIDANRRIINAEICLSSINALGGEFPDWIARNAHNAIIGCVACQDCCPANTHVKDNIVEWAIFTEEETMEILNHKADEPYSDSLIIKIEEKAGLSDWSSWKELLPRNLTVLLNK
jgi:epoxyqueuosine reductase